MTLTSRPVSKGPGTGTWSRTCRRRSGPRARAFPRRLALGALNTGSLSPPRPAPRRWTKKRAAKSMLLVAGRLSSVRPVAPQRGDLDLDLHLGLVQPHTVMVAAAGCRRRPRQEPERRDRHKRHLLRGSGHAPHPPCRSLPPSAPRQSSPGSCGSGPRPFFRHLHGGVVIAGWCPRRNTSRPVRQRGCSRFLLERGAVEDEGGGTWRTDNLKPQTNSGAGEIWAAPAQPSMTIRLENTAYQWGLINRMAGKARPMKKHPWPRTKSPMNPGCCRRPARRVEMPATTAGHETGQGSRPKRRLLEPSWGPKGLRNKSSGPRGQVLA